MESSIKPIDLVNESLRSTHNILNEVKIDIVCIKSDLMFIKERLKEINENEKLKIKNEAEISKGWLF
jgi:Icc-related predicted phosphoesterase